MNIEDEVASSKWLQDRITPDSWIRVYYIQFYIEDDQDGRIDEFYIGSDPLQGIIDPSAFINFFCLMLCKIYFLYIMFSKLFYAQVFSETSSSSIVFSYH